MREAYDRYSNVSILIHWTVAALVVVNLVIAITSFRLQPVPRMAI